MYGRFLPFLSPAVGYIEGFFKGFVTLEVEEGSSSVH